MCEDLCPAQHGQLAVAVPVEPHHRHELRRRDIVARVQVELALRRHRLSQRRQPVEVVDLLPSQCDGRTFAEATAWPAAALTSSDDRGPAAVRRSRDKLQAVLNRAYVDPDDDLGGQYRAACRA